MDAAILVNNPTAWIALHSSRPDVESGGCDILTNFILDVAFVKDQVTTSGSLQLSLDETMSRVYRTNVKFANAPIHN